MRFVLAHAEAIHQNQDNKNPSSYSDYARQRSNSQTYNQKQAPPTNKLEEFRRVRDEIQQWLIDLLSNVRNESSIH